MATSRPHPAERWGLAAFLIGAGASHFVSPDFFRPLVPDWSPGGADFAVYASGVAEIAAGAMLLDERTRRAGGWLGLATFIGVFPANIEPALNGGMDHLDGFAGTQAAAIIRLPFQLPLMWLAYRQARH